MDGELGLSHWVSIIPHPLPERKAYFHPPTLSLRQCMMGLLSEYHRHPQCIGKAYFSNLYPRLLRSPQLPFP